MKSSPTIATYQAEAENNSQKVAQLLTMLFPDLDVPYESVYLIMAYLSETKVNAAVLPRVIRGVHNIMIGTGSGQVIVHVKGDMLNVQTREQDTELKTRT
jgi:hypothetical protein